MVRKLIVFSLLAFLVISTLGATESTPLLGQTSFTFDGPGYKEFVYSVNESIVEMEYNGVQFEAIRLIFKNHTNVDWFDFRLVYFRNESRVAKPVPEENGLNSQDPDLAILDQWMFSSFIDISYPFALKDENGTWLDDPNSIKLVLYYFGNESVVIDVDIRFGYVGHRVDEITSNNFLPISWLGISIALLLSKKHKRHLKFR
ncbi:MAG: hypothetical protein D6732_25130 [Methanobacteriota archaeon]|nr:MAG: hypothetical protein D6732_25130 [Euryarchaeota archaeon]